jgi:hypothetical protein
MNPPKPAFNEGRTDAQPQTSERESGAHEMNFVPPNSVLIHLLTARSLQPATFSSDYGPASGVAPSLSAVENGAGRLLPLQAQFQVGAIDDPLENEADSVARQILRTPASSTPLARSDGEDGAGHATQLARAAIGPTTPPLREAPPSVDAALAGPSRSLDGPTRAFFESRLNVDLEAVRVHDDAGADTSARDVEAHAYTVGNDIVFGAGHYQPHSEAGRALLAHELVHVMQQGLHQPVVQRKPILELQTSAGNRATTQAVGRLLQREPAKKPPPKQAPAKQAPAKQAPAKQPTTAERLTELETRQAALEKRTAMLALDGRYRALFGERMSSYKAAVLRITGGLDAAQDGFRKAQEDQARFDALVTQLFIAVGAVGLAFGFQPLLAAGLGKLGRTADKIKDTVELWENPVLQAAGSTANIYPLAKGGRDRDVPANVRPMAFLTKNLEALELHNQGFELAFATRAGGINAAEDAKLHALDVKAWDTKYSSLLALLTAACNGVEAMKTDEQVAQIFERHIWAGWIRAQTKTLLNMDGKGVARYPAGKPTPSEPLPPGISYELDLGGDIEDRLNEIGVSKLAGVTLSGHWYSSNEPGDWERRLLTWAHDYNAVISVTAPPPPTK